MERIRSSRAVDFRRNTSAYLGGLAAVCDGEDHFAQVIVADIDDFPYSIKPETTNAGTGKKFTFFDPMALSHTLVRWVGN